MVDCYLLVDMDFREHARRTAWAAVRKSYLVVDSRDPLA
jgi:hypothetical protein